MSSTDGAVITAYSLLLVMVIIYILFLFNTTADEPYLSKIIGRILFMVFLASSVFHMMAWDRAIKHRSSYTQIGQSGDVNKSQKTTSAVTSS